MKHIRRRGWLVFALALALAACNTAPPPVVPATVTAPFATVAPTEDPALDSPSLIETALEPVGQAAQPRLRLDQDGVLHLAWLDVQANVTRLLYRQWTEAQGWTDIEVWQTWDGSRPLQWDMALDGSDVPHAMWSTPGALTLLRRSGPGVTGTQPVPLPLGGDRNAPQYTTNFAFVLRGSAIYVVYRDRQREAPYFRLGYSSNSGKEWNPGAPILTDPAAPTQIHAIGLTASEDDVLHLIMSAGSDQLYLHSNPTDRDHWRGLMGGQDLFEQGRLGRDVLLDSHGFPHVILENAGQVYYALWDGRMWVGPYTPLIWSARGVESMAFALGPDDLTWLIGTAPPSGVRGLWLRTYRSGEASDPALLKTGNVTECDIEIGPDRVHIVAVIDGQLWHLTDRLFLGAGLPRHTLQ